METDLSTKILVINDGWNDNLHRLDRMSEQMDRMDAKIDILEARTLNNEADIQLLKRAK